MKSLLKINGFLPFLAIMFINASVDLGHKITIQNVLVKSADSGALIALTSLVNLLILLPYVFLFSASGYLNDKFSRTRITRICAKLGVALTALITLGYLCGWFYFAFFMTILLAAQSAIYSPAKYGLIKKIVGAKNLGAANGLVQALTIIAILLSSLVFSVIFELFAARSSDAGELMSSVWFIGVLLVAGSVLETYYSYKIPFFDAAQPQAEFDAKEYLRLRYLKQNLKFVIKDKNVLLCTLGLSMFWAVSQLVIATFPAHYKSLSGSDNVMVIQVILALSAIGIALGSIFAGSYCKKHIELGIVPFGAFGLALALMVLANAHSVFWLGTASFFFGFSGGIFIVPLNAVIQFFTADERMGRVLAGSNFIQNIFMVLFLLIAIILVHFAVASGEIFVMAALCVLICGIFGAKYLPQLSVRILLIPFMKFGYQVHVDGIENIPQKGGVLLLGNHISWIDWAVVQLACPRGVRFVMHRSYYDLWYLKWFFKIFRVIPIGAGVSKSAIESIREALNTGEVVGLFPEGHISYNGRIDEFQGGFELAAHDTNSVIVPFYIRGLWGSTFSRASEHYKRTISQSGKNALRVSFGAPIEANSKAHEVKRAVTELSFFSWGKYLASLKPLAYNWLNQAKRSPFKRVAVDSTGASLTNLAMMSAVLILRKRLKSRISSEENVGIVLPSSVIASAVNLTLFAMGKTSVNLNYTLSKENLIYCADKANIRTIISSRKFVEKLKSKGFELESSIGDRLVYLEDLSGGASKNERIACALKSLLMPKILFRALYFKPHAIEDVATILFSSGSEGKPKGVVLTHKNIMANVRQISELINATEHDAILASLPIFHCFGLTVTTLFPLNDGILSIHVPDPTDAFSVGKMSAKYGATIMFGTSTFFRLYTKNKRLNPLMLASIRLAIAGAEKLNENVRKEFKIKFGIEIYEGYGTTETAPVVSVNTPNVLEPDFFKELHFNREKSVGLPLAGTVIKITDPASLQPLSNGQEGLILIGGHQVMKEYYDEPAKTAEAIAQINDVHYYKSGDIGYIDDDGFLFITDRLSRFAKIGGEMISLGAVESAVGEILGESAIYSCVNLKDEKKGEKIALLYVGEASEDEISRRLKDSALAPIMQPSVVKKVEQIPVLGSGKVNLKAVKDLAIELGL